jgi:hypothetical protein
VRAIMATQLSRDARLARADDVIDNSGPPAALDPQVARLDADYRARAAVAHPTSASGDSGTMTRFRASRS